MERYRIVAVPTACVMRALVARASVTLNVSSGSLMTASAQIGTRISCIFFPGLKLSVPVWLTKSPDGRPFAGLQLLAAVAVLAAVA
jgi:hypothetical protein